MLESLGQGLQSWYGSISGRVLLSWSLVLKFFKFLFNGNNFISNFSSSFVAWIIHVLGRGFCINTEKR